MLSVECLGSVYAADECVASGDRMTEWAHPREHGMNGREVGLAFRAAVDARAGEVTTVAHAHGEEVLVVVETKALERLSVEEDGRSLVQRRNNVDGCDDDDGGKDT